MASCGILMGQDIWLCVECSNWLALGISWSMGVHFMERQYPNDDSEACM